jgi:murein DD-endopeptidase MepM/ murein hydrolase activator NlpD
MTLRHLTVRACRAALITAAFGVAAASVAATPDALQKGDKLQALPAADAATISGTDDQFHSLFLSWQRQDQVGTQSGIGAMAVPSTRPLNTATFTSGYGVRSDPFRGQAAMHAGIDLAAPTGTAVYATADGLVGRAQWEGGYGNMVEVDHGKGLATRFGHLSRILVHPGQVVHRGDLIALVGSTGRSTGPHLHYEVRIDGHAVNPVPFLQASDYAVAMREKASAMALGGPDDVD